MYIIEGDRNTAYFLAIANQRRERNAKISFEYDFFYKFKNRHYIRLMEDFSSEEEKVRPEENMTLED